MNKILFVSPISGNGGIQSWTKKMIASFSDEEFELYHINVAYRRSVLKHETGIRRKIDGIIDLYNVYSDVKKALNTHSFSLMHTTTSGNIGTLRDYILVKLCHKHNIPCILHCRYGCIAEDFVKNDFWGKLLRKTLHLYDNVWVLDRCSEQALKRDPKMQNKVFLTPNSIEVPLECDLSPKKYKNIAFVGNLIAKKGLFELVHAVLDYGIDVKLTLAGPDSHNYIPQIKDIAGDRWGNKIDYVGKLTNPEAVKLIQSMDMICLASYYPSEAFPISIIEAMSYGKLVIGTKRAAIGDMLTDVDGNDCGCFVREQSSEDIANAIRWCQNNFDEADNRCAKAYEKVKKCYSTEVVYKLYRSLYRKLISPQC